MTDREGIGERFQRETAYYAGRQPDWPPRPKRKPSAFKEYKGAERIALPLAEAEGGPAIWETVAARRSERRYRKEPISLASLARLLWSAQGITDPTADRVLRAAPSAGATYPLESYVIAHCVEDLDAGIYHYDVRRHALETIDRGDFRRAVGRPSLGQGIVRRAAAVVLWSAVFDRARWEYGERAFRYVYLDAGHAAQNLALAAVALGLGSCPIGAFLDGELSRLVGLDGDAESVIYGTTVGRID